jgi:hypothetical protein
MKKIILLSMAAMMFASCAQVYYYTQVFEAKPSAQSNIKADRDGMVYEDDQCVLFYTFWAKGGDASFLIHNKSDKMMYVDLSKSFFIRNGIANDYYKERAWSQTTSEAGAQTQLTDTYGVLRSRAYANTYATSASSTEAIKEQKILAIPPHAYKIVSEYTINAEVLRNCELDRYPADTASITFEEKNSPLTFSNYVTYRLGDADQEYVVENTFYIAKVTNYARPYVYKYIEREKKPCQNMTDDDSKVYNDTYPVKVYDKVYMFDCSNRYYVEYEILTKRKLYKKEQEYYYDYRYDGYTTEGGDEQTAYRKRLLDPFSK